MVVKSEEMAPEDTGGVASIARDAPTEADTGSEEGEASAAAASRPASVPRRAIQRAALSDGSVSSEDAKWGFVDRDTRRLRRAGFSAVNVRTFMIDGKPVRARRASSEQRGGLRVRVPNSLWPRPANGEWNPRGITPCLVVGQCLSPFLFPRCRKAHPAFIIKADDDGEYYPIRADVLRYLQPQPVGGQWVPHGAPRAPKGPPPPSAPPTPPGSDAGEEEAKGGAIAQGRRG